MYVCSFVYKVFILVEPINESKRSIRLKYVFLNVSKIRGNAIDVPGIICITAYVLLHRQLI